MKKVILALFLVLVAGMASAHSKDNQGVKETRKVSGFTKIGFGIAGDLYINIGSEFRVELEGPKSLLDEIETELSGSKLVIKKDTWHTFGNEKVTVYITLPALEGLSVSGSGKAEVKDAVKSEELHLSVSGSGKILMADLAIGDLDVGISGSGDVIIGGSGDARNADISISGSGNYSGESLRIANGDFGISGSGSCRCNVTDKLEASVSGSGNVTYLGNPKVDARVSGSGRVRSK